MKLGNPKLVMGLVIGNLIVIAFVLTNSSSSQARSSRSAVGAGKHLGDAGPLLDPLPTTLVGNPFFHRSLVLESKLGGPTGLAVSSNLSLKMPPVEVSSLPMAPTPNDGFSLGMSRDRSPMGPGPLGPSRAATRLGGAIASSVPKPIHSISLRATVTSDHPVALISVDGNPSCVYRVGDEPITGMRLAEIDRGSVSIVSAGKHLTVLVGEKLNP